MGKLEGKVAIITGSGRGIGRGIALAMAKEGAKIALVERKLSTAEEVQAEIETFGGAALAIACDVGQQEDVIKAVKATVARFGTVDILVNNAQNHPPIRPLEEHTTETVLKTLTVGLLGAFWLMQECLPLMKDKGGKIINIGSAIGTTGAPGWVPYAATKEAVAALSRCAAREWGKYLINVNVINPIAQTPSTDGTDIPGAGGAIDEIAKGFPIARMGNPESDIGRVAVFLASSDSDYITGQTFYVDGGATIHAGH